MLQHYKDYWSNLEDVPFQITEFVQEFINIPFSCFEGTRFCNKLIFLQFKKSIPNVPLYRIVKISGNKNLMFSLAFSTKIKVLMSYLIILKSRHFEALLKKKFILLLLPVLSHFHSSIQKESSFIS